jgi:decaprenylphospho-beta-D-ribofuranose 2-oxidase
MTSITNWNNYPIVEAEVFDLSIPTSVSNFAIRGNGKCYGDASLFRHIGSTLKMNKVLGFDPSQGVIKCQAGILLAQILKIIIPEGWFLPVTPGTKFITLGGAVASDVHGKNHHKEGSFSAFVTEINLLTGTGEIKKCSKSNEADLFWATCGGMGLTGLIQDVTIQLKKIVSPLVRNIAIRARNLNEIMHLFEEYYSWTYTMAWIDCLASGKRTGRSIFMAGEHSAEIENQQSAVKKPFITVPFYLPSFILNTTTASIFNAFYFNVKRESKTPTLSHYDSFFYPLDFVSNWNKVYSKKGFIQYQFVIPLAAGKEGLIKILSKINASGFGVYLAVLKLFGEENGLMSFPMKGYTLALDIPIKRGLLTFLDELDKMVAGYGGRIYLSKDARMSKEIFWATYPNAPRFKELLNKYDPENQFVSLMAQRLALKD